MQTTGLFQTSLDEWVLPDLGECWRLGEIGAVDLAL